MKRAMRMRALALVMAAVCALAPAISFSLESNCQCSKNSPCSSDGYICLCCHNGPQARLHPEAGPDNASHTGDAGHGASAIKTPAPCYAEIGHCASTLEVMAQSLPPAAQEYIVFVQEGHGPLLAVITPYDDSACPGFHLPEDPPPLEKSIS